MLKRILIYIRETPKLWSFVLVAFLVAAVTHLMLDVLYSLERTRISGNYLIGIVSYALYMWYWRVTDELKDYETDKRVFPERPVPAGRVKIADIKALAVGVVIALVVLNAKLWNVAFGYFLFVLVYIVLMSKWFFAEKLVANNRMVAFVTHSPTTIFANYYLIAIFCNDNHLPVFTRSSLLTVLWICLPLFAAEFARKTYPPSQEVDGYQTYSAMIGYRNSALVALAFVLLQLMLSIWLQMHYAFHATLVVSAVVLFLVYALITVVFIGRPDKYFKPFVGYSGLYTLLIYIALMTGAMIKT
jgi:4-hydroxybenzoate polyprenyltransferase